MGVFTPQKLANAQISPAPFPIHQHVTVFKGEDEYFLKVLFMLTGKHFYPRNVFNH